MKRQRERESVWFALWGDIQQVATLACCVGFGGRVSNMCLHEYFVCVMLWNGYVI